MEEERPDYADTIQVGKRRSSLGALTKSKPVTKLKSMFETKGAVPKHKESGLLSKLKPVSASHDASSFSAAICASFSAAGPQTISFPAPAEMPPATPTQPLFSVLHPPPEQDAAPHPSPPLSVEDIRTSSACYNESIHDGSEADARSAKSPGSAGFLKRMGSSLKRALTPKSSSGKQKRSPSYAGSEVSNLSPRPSGQLLLTPASQPSSTSLDLNCRSDQLQSAPVMSPSVSMGYEVHSAHEDQDWTNERSREGSVDMPSRPTTIPPRPPLSPMSFTPSGPVPDGAASQLAASPPHSTSLDIALRLSAETSPDQTRGLKDGTASGAPMAPEDSFMSADGNCAPGCSPAASSAIDAEDSFAASLTASPTIPEGSEASRSSPPMREVNMGADVLALPPPFALPAEHGATSEDAVAPGQGKELVFPSLAATSAPSDSPAVVNESTDGLYSGASTSDTITVQATASGPVDVDMEAPVAVPADDGPAAAPHADVSPSPKAGTAGADAQPAAWCMDVDMDETPAPMTQPEISEEPSFNSVQLAGRRSFGAAASINLDLSGAVAGPSSPGSPDATTPTFGVATADTCIIGLTPIRPDATVSTSINMQTLSKPALSTVVETSPEASPLPPVSPSPSDHEDAATDSGHQEMDVEAGQCAIAPSVGEQTGLAGDAEAVEEQQQGSALDIATSDAGYGTAAAPEQELTASKIILPSTVDSPCDADRSAVPLVAADDMDCDNGPAISVPAATAAVEQEQRLSPAASPVTITAIPPTVPAFTVANVGFGSEEPVQATLAAGAMEILSSADGSVVACSAMDMGTTANEAQGNLTAPEFHGISTSPRPVILDAHEELAPHTAEADIATCGHATPSGSAPMSSQASLSTCSAAQCSSPPSAAIPMAAPEQATAATVSAPLTEPPAAFAASNEEQAVNAAPLSLGNVAVQVVEDAPAVAADACKCLGAGAVSEGNAAPADMVSAGASFGSLPAEIGAVAPEIALLQAESSAAEPMEAAEAEAAPMEADLAAMVVVPSQAAATVTELTVVAPVVAGFASAGLEQAADAPPGTMDIDMDDVAFCDVKPSDDRAQTEDAPEAPGMAALPSPIEAAAAPVAGSYVLMAGGSVAAELHDGAHFAAAEEVGQCSDSLDEPTPQPTIASAPPTAVPEEEQQVVVESGAETEVMHAAAGTLPSTPASEGGLVYRPPIVANEVAEPQHSEPQHSEPQHSEPQHSEPQHSELEPTEPQPGEPQHSEPEPTESQHSELEPTEPQPGEPEPSEPEPTEPQHSELEPTEPQHSEQEPTEPQHSELEPTEPQHSELEPTEPEPQPTEPQHALMVDSDGAAAPLSNGGIDRSIAVTTVNSGSEEASIPTDGAEMDPPAAADATALPVAEIDAVVTAAEPEMPSAFQEAMVEASAAAAFLSNMQLPGQQQPMAITACPDTDMDLMDVDSSVAGAQAHPAQSTAVASEASYADAQKSEPAPGCPHAPQLQLKYSAPTNAGEAPLAYVACTADQQVAVAASPAPEMERQQDGVQTSPASALVTIGMDVTAPPMRLTPQSMEHDYDVVAFGSAASDLSYLDGAIAAIATTEPWSARQLASLPQPETASTADAEGLSLPNMSEVAAADTTVLPSESQAEPICTGSPSQPPPEFDATVEDDPMMVSPMPQRLSMLPTSLRLVPDLVLPPASPDASATNAPVSAARSAGTPGMPTPISPETARIGVRAFQLDDIDEPEAAVEVQATTTAPMQEQVVPDAELEPAVVPHISPAASHESSPVAGGEASLPTEPSTVAKDASEPVPAFAMEDDHAMTEDAPPPATTNPATAPVGVDVPMADSLEAIEALWGNDDLLGEGGDGDGGFGLPLPQAASSPVKHVEVPSHMNSVRKVAPDVVLQVERESLDLFSLRNSCAGRVSDSLMVESLDSFEGAGICAKSRAVAFVPMAPLNEANEQEVDEDSSSPVDFGRLAGPEGGSASTGPPSPNLTFAAVHSGSPRSDGMPTPGLQPANNAGASTPSACKPAAVGSATRGATSNGKPGVASATKSVTPSVASRANATPSTALKALAAANASGSSAGKAAMSKRPIPVAAPHAKPLTTPGPVTTVAGAAPGGSRLPGVSATPGAGVARPTAGAASAKPPAPSPHVAATPGAASGRLGFTPRGTALSGIGQAPATGNGRAGSFMQQAAALRSGAGHGLFDTPLILRAAAVPLADSPFPGCDFDLDTVDISAEASRAIAMLGAGDGSAGGAGPTTTQQATPVLAVPGRGAAIAGTPTQSVLETHVLLLTSKLAEAEASIHQLQDENGMLRDQLSTLQFESSMTNDLDMEREARQFLEQELAVVRHRSDGLEADLRTAHAEAKRREQASTELLAAHQTKEAEWARREAEMEVRMQQMHSELDAARSFAQQADVRVTQAEAQSSAATTKCDEEAARSRELQVTLGLQAHQLVQVQRARDEAEAKFQKAMEQLIAAQTSHKKQVLEYEQKLQQQNTIISQFGEYRDRYRQMKQHVADTDQRAQHAEAKAQESANALGMAQVEKQELMRMCNELLTQLEATKAKAGR